MTPVSQLQTEASLKLRYKQDDVIRLKLAKCPVNETAANFEVKFNEFYRRNQ